MLVTHSRGVGARCCAQRACDARHAWGCSAWLQAARGHGVRPVAVVVVAIELSVALIRRKTAVFQGRQAMTLAAVIGVHDHW